MPAPIRAVLFDYGNVLVGWSPRKLYARLIPDPDQLDYFLDHVCPMSWHMLHDEGQEMAVTIPARQAEFPEFAAEIAAWKTGFAEMITGEITGSTQLVSELAAANIPQYVLTNMPSEMVETCFGPFDFPRYFKQCSLELPQGYSIRLRAWRHHFLKIHMAYTFCFQLNL